MIDFEEVSCLRARIVHMRIFIKHIMETTHTTSQFKMALKQVLDDDTAMDEAFWKKKVLG
jgi:hypothetical protein